jgi:hypothetical protein
MRYFFSILLFYCIAVSSCRKDTNLELPTVPGRAYDTTTVERIEVRLDAPGSFLVFDYYFYYDSAYRIKRSVMIDYVNGPNPPDTGIYRQYFYNGTDSLPYKLIYGHNSPGAPGAYMRDTAWFFYDARNRLVKDSGTTFEDVGFGVSAYWKRIRTLNYINSDSMLLTHTTQPLTGGGSINSGTTRIKNIDDGTQKIQKFYTSAGALSQTFITAYDSFKNPLAKALPQFHPYYDYIGLANGDGNFSWHLPQPTNRIYFAKLIGTTGIYHSRDSISVKVNAQQLPVEMVVKSLLGAPGTNLKISFHY